jgi:hypothetical protein
MARLATEPGKRSNFAFSNGRLLSTDANSMSGISMPKVAAWRSENPRVINRHQNARFDLTILYEIADYDNA